MRVESVQITRGAAAIGSHLVDEPLDRGHRIDAVGLRARQQAERYSAAVMADLTLDVHSRALSRTRSKGGVLRCA